MQVPSQSLCQSTSASWQTKEFNRRRELFEYKLHTDEEIWEEIEKEAEEDKKPKPIVVPIPEQKEDINAFLLDIFKNYWGYTQEQLDLARQNLKPQMINPATINWDQRKQNIVPALFGQYTLNPATQNLDFKNTSISFQPNWNYGIRDLVGQPFYAVVRYLVSRSNTPSYGIPGIEYLKYVIENPDSKETLKDDNCYLLFGSILRYKDGGWCVLGFTWHNSSFVPQTFPLLMIFVDRFDVLLLSR